MRPSSSTFISTSTPISTSISTSTPISTSISTSTPISNYYTNCEFSDPYNILFCI